jgi:hypothetical protein
VVTYIAQPANSKSAEQKTDAFFKTTDVILDLGHNLAISMACGGLLLV